jgi:hypothetical protein
MTYFEAVQALHDRLADTATSIPAEDAELFIKIWKADSVDEVAVHVGTALVAQT